MASNELKPCHEVEYYDWHFTGMNPCYGGPGDYVRSEDFDAMRQRVELLEGLLVRARRRLWTNPAETLPSDIDAALAKQT